MAMDIPHAFSELQAVIGCQQAIHRFYAALDASDMDAVSLAMAEDGVWHRQGQALRGPASVRAALAQRPAGRRTAHLVQNLVVDVIDPGQAQAQFMTLVYRHDADAPVTGAAPLGAPLSISFHRERLVRGDSGVWQFAEKRSERRFAS
jgi:ketosteroid isomerase-like protein